METEQLYNRLRSRHPSIVAVSGDQLLRIHHEWIEYEKDEDTHAWNASVIGLIVGSIITFSLFKISLGITERIGSPLLSVIDRGSLFLDHFEALTITLFCLGQILGALFALVYLPRHPNIAPALLRSIKNRQNSNSLYYRSVYGQDWLPRINIRSKPFIILHIILCYMFAIVGLILVNSSYLLSAELIWILGRLLMMIPFTVFAILCGYAVVRAVGRLYQRLSRPGRRVSIPSAIIVLFMRMMDNMDSKNDLDVANLELREDTASAIQRGVRLLDRMYGRAPENRAAWLLTKYRARAASDTLQSLEVRALLPNSGTIAFIKEQLLIYLNCFLSGNYADIPIVPFDPEFSDTCKTKLKRRSILFFPAFLLYIAFPVIALLLIHFVFDIKIDSGLYPLFTVLFIVWSLGGFLIFAERLSSESRAFSLEFLRLFFSGK